MSVHAGLARRFCGCQSGAAAIEFAIIAMALIMVCLGTIEFGRAFFLRNELSFAADFAARKILTDPDITDTELSIEVEGKLTGLDTDLLNVTFGSESADGIAFRTILMTYPMTLLVPGLSTESIELTLSRRIPAG